MKYIVIDIETTGLYAEKGDRIIEIAGVPIIGDKLLIEESFNQLINPGINIPDNIVKLVNITDDMVKEAPSIEDVLPAFIDYINDSPLIAHNASFDIGFLNFYLSKLNLKIINNRIIDTILLSREVFSEEKFHNLDIVATRLGLNKEGISRHRALDDAILTAKVFIKLIEML